MPGNLLVFLSHAGVDTPRAKALKQRLESAPSAQTSGLKVWLDKDDLKPGTGWQAQLEDAIQKQASSFIVYVGSRGVINWVESEVRLGVARAVTDKAFRFIPVIAKECSDVAALPGFVGQFHGVKDVENDGAAFARLLAALLDGGEAGSIKAEKEPFFGLRAINEERAYLFFGREQETREVLTRLAQNRLLMVIGDSGSGKSSLVRAGIVSQWRGGALAAPGLAERDESYWHVVQFRPGLDPWQSLGDAVFAAAGVFGATAADRGTYRDWVIKGDPQSLRLGLQCGLDAACTQTLIVVDQFEELFTSRVALDQRRRFVEALLALLDDPTFYVIMTMRRDYYNLLASSETKSLFDVIESDGHVRRYSLRRMTDEGLRRIVLEPLKLTGESATQADALANAVLGDVGDRPGDLALVEFALTKAWERSGQTGATLLESYTAIGGVEGALAGEAERVYRDVLGGDANVEEISATLIRLAQLTGGAGPVRRMARRREFSEARWKTLQILASRNGNRLVLIAGRSDDEDHADSNDTTAEIAHEALFIRWPRLFAWLNAAEPDKRILENLTERAIAWADEDDKRKDARLAKGDAERESFQGVLARHGSWLSEEERNFVEASVKANDARLKRERALRLGAWAAAGVAIVLAVAAGLFGVGMYTLQQQQALAIERIKESEGTMRQQQSRLLARSATKAIGDGKIFTAARLALAGLDFIKDDSSAPSEAADALSAAGAMILPNLVSRHDDEILAVQWEKKSHAVLSLDRRLVLGRSSYDQPDPQARFRPTFPSADRGESKVVALAVAADTRSVAVVRAFSTDDGNNLQVWRFASDGSQGRELCRLSEVASNILAKWAPDGKRIAVASGGTLVICTEGVALVRKSTRSILFAWSPGSDKVVVASERGVEIVDVTSDSAAATPLPSPGNTFGISSVAWSGDGTQIVAGMRYSGDQLWRWAKIDGAWTQPESQKGLPPGQSEAIEWATDNDRVAMIVSDSGYPSPGFGLFVWQKSKQSNFEVDGQVQSMEPLDVQPDKVRLSSIAWARDGRLASIDDIGNDRVVRVRNPMSPVEAVSVVLAFGPQEQSSVPSLAWTADGQLVVVALINSEVCIWSLPKASLATASSTRGDLFEHADISSGGTNFVAARKNGSVVFGGTGPGTALRELQPAQSPPQFVKVTPDGARVAWVSRTGGIFHFDQTKGTCHQVGQLPRVNNESEIIAAALSDDGTHFAVLMQNPARVFDYQLSGGEVRETPIAGSPFVSSGVLAWSHTGLGLAVGMQYATSGDPSSELLLLQYDEKRNASPQVRRYPWDSRSGVDDLSWSVGGKLAVAVAEGSNGIRLVRRLLVFSPELEMRSFDAVPASKSIAMRWQGEDQLLAAIRETSNRWGGSTVISYEGDAFTARKLFESPGDFVGFLASGSKYRAALFRSGPLVTLHDFDAPLVAGAETHWLDFKDRLIDDLIGSWADSGLLILASKEDGQVTAFDGTRTFELQSYQHVPLALAVNDDGQIASITAGRTLRFWNGPDSTPRTIELPRPSYWWPSIAWAPDGKHLAVLQSGQTLIFSRREDGTLDRTSDMSGGTASAWWGTSKIAVARSESGVVTIEICVNPVDCKRESKRVSLPEPGSDRNSPLVLTWSDDGKKLVISVATKAYVRITSFDPDQRLEQSGQTPAFTEIALVNRTGKSLASALSADGRYFASAIGQRLYIWPQDDLNGLKRRIVGRIGQSGLTPDERRLAGFSDLR